MRERRSIVEGLKPGEIDPEVARRFIRGDYAAAEQEVASSASDNARPAPAAEARDEKGQGGNSLGRVPLTIRFRSDFAALLKRASLQRQLDGVSPHTLQDILEEALEPWLRAHGYLG